MDLIKIFDETIKAGVVAPNLSITKTPIEATQDTNAVKTSRDQEAERCRSDTTKCESIDHASFSFIALESEQY